MENIRGIRREGRKERMKREVGREKRKTIIIDVELLKRR